MKETEKTCGTCERIKNKTAEFIHFLQEEINRNPEAEKNKTIMNAGVVMSDMPKIESPFKREDVDGKYVCVPEMEEGYDWIFDKSRCVAVEKLDGTNVSVYVQGGRVTRILNRTQPIEILGNGSGRFMAGIAQSIEEKKFIPLNMQDGQHFGELIGPRIQGNPYKLAQPLWLPFSYVKKRYVYNFWNNFVDSLPPALDEKLSEISDLFSGLWSLYKRDAWTKENIPFSPDSITGQLTHNNSAAAEGIMFYDDQTGAMCKLRRDMFA